MSHTILPFAHSNLVTIDYNKFLIEKEEPVYTASELVIYDFSTKTQETMKIPKSFAGYFDYSTIIVKQNFDLFGKLPKCTILYKSDYYDHPQPKYDNLKDFPELETFFNSFNPVRPNHVSYGEKDKIFKLEVWHECAYVVVRDSKITSYHINAEYDLQSGDSCTYVWHFNNNFVVYNYGDVYSVVIISENGG
jgi:hypothetical protein